ncbi:MAG: zinc dependent phospholipase C family protein [Phycisphaerales bacterium]
MPANIAHMVIAHKALALLKEKGFEGLANFATMLDDSTEGEYYQQYMNLGSVGPDLYYYANMVQSTKEMMFEGFVEAAGVTPWSYHLHSQKPNEFPLRLAAVLFSDVIREGGKTTLEADDRCKLAYIAGHLSHVAADQIIHPLVNTIAKPYYRSGGNRKKHRECEVYQDYFLYEEVYRDKRNDATGKAPARYDFFKQDFEDWVDCIQSLMGKNTYDWFRYFLQRGFAETYGPFPDEDTIEDSVDNLLLVLRLCKLVGPYKKAEKEYRKYGPAGPMYTEYIAAPGYMPHFKQAVCLSAVYIAALHEVYTVLLDNGDFTQSHRDRFLDVVRAADLSCPLEQDILQKARTALTRCADGEKYESLFEPS